MRPSAKKTGEVGTKMGAEMKLWKEVMAHLYGEDWQQQLIDYVPDEEEEEEEDLPSIEDSFRMPRKAGESFLEVEARQLRAGRNLKLASKPITENEEALPTGWMRPLRGLSLRSCSLTTWRGVARFTATSAYGCCVTEER